LRSATSEMKFQVLDFTRLAVMLSSILRLTRGYVRPSPKVDLQATIDAPAPLVPNGRNWVDTGGLSYKQPIVSASELKIISYNVLGIRMFDVD
jgi:hypothetical protein